MGFFAMKNIFKVVFVIIGTLIGAGFASGQEMYLFFFSYGIEGLIGIVVSCILMGLIIYKALCLIDKYNIKTYKEFLEMFIKPKQNESFFNLKNIVNIVINIFILVTFFSYLWVDDIEAKTFGKKSVDNTLDWFWKKI